MLSSETLKLWVCSVYKRLRVSHNKNSQSLNEKRFVTEGFHSFCVGTAGYLSSNEIKGNISFDHLVI